MKRLIAAILLSLVPFVGCVSGRELVNVPQTILKEMRGSNIGVCLTAKLDMETNVKGSSVLLVVEINNTGTNGLKVPTTADFADYHLQLLDRDGKPAALTPHGQSLIDAGNKAERKEYDVPAGKGLVSRFYLNKLFDLSAPGSYRITGLRPVIAKVGNAYVMYDLKLKNLEFVQK